MKKLLLVILFFFTLASCAWAGEILFNITVENLAYADRAVWAGKIASLPANFIVEGVSYIEVDDAIFGKKGQMTFKVTIQSVAEDQINSVKTRIINFSTGYFVTVTNFHYKEDGIL